MRLATLRGIAVGVILFLATAHGLSAAHNAGAVLVRPKQMAKVEDVSEIVGKALSPGFPIVLVRADQPNCLWWAQERPKKTSPEHFRTSARFGNEKTPEGNKFRIVVLMVPNADGAKQYEPGASFKKLPDLPRSVETVVVLEKKALEEEAGLPQVIVSPAQDSRVARVGSITGQLTDGGKPIVLVRAVSGNSLWWIQAKPEASDDGHFTASAHFGNDKTPAGTRFRIVVISATSKQADPLRVGVSLKDLPDGLPRSKEVEVIRRDSAASTSATSPAAGE